MTTSIPSNLTNLYFKIIECKILLALFVVNFKTMHNNWRSTWSQKKTCGLAHVDLS